MWTWIFDVHGHPTILKSWKSRFRLSYWAAWGILQMALWLRDDFKGTCTSTTLTHMRGLRWTTSLHSYHAWLNWRRKALGGSPSTNFSPILMLKVVRMRPQMWGTPILFSKKTLGYVYHCMIEMAWRNAIGEKLSKLRQVALLIAGTSNPTCNSGPLDWIGKCLISSINKS